MKTFLSNNGESAQRSPPFSSLERFFVVLSEGKKKKKTSERDSKDEESEKNLINCQIAGTRNLAIYEAESPPLPPDVDFSAARVAASVTIQSAAGIKRNKDRKQKERRSFHLTGGRMSSAAAAAATAVRTLRGSRASKIVHRRRG